MMARRQGKRRRAIIATAVLVLGGLTLVIGGLAGCGSAPYPQIVGQNCGAILGGPGVSVDPNEGEQCLWSAYTTCQAATLVYTQVEVDVGETHAVTVRPQGQGCAVTDAVQGYSANGGGSRSAVITYRCSELRQQGGGLLLVGCGEEGDVVIPPRPAEQVGHVCGMISASFSGTDRLVFAAYAQDTVAGSEACFWQAYAGGCAHAVSLLYTVDDQSRGRFAHTLVAQAQGGACALSDAVSVDSKPPVTYACTGMIQVADGSLVVRDCGAEGDVPVPPATPPQP